MDPVRYSSRPDLARPVLISAFHGWNDAADAATMALGYLQRRLDASSFASIDPEEFYVFSDVRPTVSLSEDDIRHVDWPKTEFWHASVPGAGRDAVLLEAVEPSMRWQTYCSAVLDVARTAGVELVVTLGALLANRPHTRSVKVTGTAVDPELANRLGLSRSRYEGPTGIVGILHDACRNLSIPAVSLWAWVPVYLQNSPSPPAALELVRRLQGLLDFEVDTAELESASDAYRDRVSEAVGADPDIADQVEEMERQSDNEELEDLPSGDELAAELERFLKDQDGGSG
jgi:proteasome assembly chaperone (PAC2) family protein